YEACFAQLCEHLLGDLTDPASATRLRDVQHLLCELVETLDKRQIRYAENDLTRA
ncbi:MAG: hypothetical protein QOJ63_98, partial [Solirubrobacteraceae bacterium]|nr:hypothetical protein [Solirubrobacteraceae bacterium]